MLFNEFSTDTRRNNGLYVLLIFLLVLGVTVGSTYLARQNSEIGEGIKTYIGDFFASFSENRNNLVVFKNSLTANLISLTIIFVMGFFKFGFIVTGAVIVRKGFITGFTAASFIKFYGIKGMLVMLSTMPTVIITIPALLFFSVVSVKLSLYRERKQKKIIISYIFFLILTISIFCVASLTEGYLTTTFMSWISL